MFCKYKLFVFKTKPKKFFIFVDRNNSEIYGLASAYYIRLQSIDGEASY